MSLYPDAFKQMIREFNDKGYWKQEIHPDFLKKHARERPDSEALVQGEKRISFGQLSLKADRIALSLLELGIRKGDVVGVQLPDWAEVCCIRFALSQIGVILVPLSIRFRHSELIHALSMTEAKAVVITEEFHDYNYLEMFQAIGKNVPSLKHIVIAGKTVRSGFLSLDKMMEEPIETRYRDDYLKRFRPDANDLDVLILTSGTTGLPKIVMHTHNTVLQVGMAQMKKYGIGPNDSILVLPPLTLATGLNNSTSALASGMKVVVNERFEAETALQLIERERVTRLMAVPTQLIKMLEVPDFHKYDLSSLGLIASGGASLAADVQRKIEERMGSPVLNMYGSIDAGLGTFTNVEDPPERRYGAVGLPVENTELKLVDEKGNEVPRGQVGEVMFRGPITSAGYYKDPEATHRLFHTDGWRHSGDLGMVDDYGYLRIVGREKDLIVRGGEKISAEEIEELLHTHPKVVDAAVVAMPDARLGEKACAYVIAARGENLTFDEMISFLKAKGLATHKLPERLELATEFPLSPGGKVQKKALREDISAKLAQENR